MNKWTIRNLWSPPVELYYHFIYKRHYIIFKWIRKHRHTKQLTFLACQGFLPVRLSSLTWLCLSTQLYSLFCVLLLHPRDLSIFLPNVLLLATRDPSVIHHWQQAGDSKKVSESFFWVISRMDLGRSPFWKATVEIWTATNCNDSFAN